MKNYRKVILLLILVGLIGCTPSEYARVDVNVSGIHFHRSATQKRCRKIAWTATNTTNEVLILQGMRQPGRSTENPIVVSWVKQLKPKEKVKFGQLCSYGENSLRIVNKFNVILGVFKKHRHNEYGNPY